MTAPDGPRKITRSKTGCLQCHRQRCDEAKPVCKRCTRNKRQCEYASNKVVAFVDVTAQQSLRHQHQQQQLRKPRSVLVPIKVEHTPSPTPSLSHEDPVMLNAFQYYLEQVLPCFSSTPTATTLDLWHPAGATLLRASNSVLVYFMAALSSLHQASWTGESSSFGSHAFYLNCINKGIKLLVHNIEHASDLTTSLYASHLLRILEFWRTGSVEVSRTHVKGLRGMLAKVEQQGNLDPELLAMVKSAKFIIAEQAALFDACAATPDAARAYAMPFSNLSLAIKSMYSLFVYWLLPMARTNRSTWVARPQQPLVTNLLAVWRSSFEQLLAQTAPADRNPVIEAHLWLQWSAAGLFRASATPSFLVNAQFRQLMSTLERLGASRIEDPRCTWEIISTLALAFVVFLRCRDAAIRQQALAHMQSFEQTDGVWNSRVAALIARATVQMEHTYRAETRVTQDVVALPERASCTFDKSGSARVHVRFGIGQGVERSLAVRIKADEPELLQACRDTQWPLEAVLQSHGCMSSNNFPITSVVTPGIIADSARVRAARAHLLKP